MKKNYLILTIFLIPLFFYAQNPEISGVVKDTDGNPIEFVNILLFPLEGETPLKGVVSEADGTFKLTLPEEKSYNIKISFVGFKTQSQKIEPPYNFIEMVLEEDTQSLEETVITTSKPLIKKEAGKLIFNVENSSFTTGSTVSLLSKTPGVLVMGNSISIKNMPTTIFINGKRVYLSSEEIVSLLSSLDASVVKQVEVITNPSSKYDAETGAVLNIVTSKAVSIGYKGFVSTNYEQGVFSKYRFTTAHFYKNNWVNLYGSYTYAPRKEHKKDETKNRYFNPDNSLKSFWDNKFKRITYIESHQANLVTDFTINEKQTLSFSATALVTPYKKYKNTMSGIIYNPNQQIDSTYSGSSKLTNDTHNISFNVSHTLSLGEKGASLNTAANYIIYSNTQNQLVNTSYFDSDANPLTTNIFNTEANQDTDIVVLQTDLTTPFAKGTLETGVKYSDIQTDSGLDFYDIIGNSQLLNTSLSDQFDYKERIFGMYASYNRQWEKWEIELGLRAENTDVTGDSKSLGIVNNQSYLDWFPAASLTHILKNQNPISLSYKRSITRPRYQSLNPFKYFITDNSFNEGNPKLIPAIDDKITLSYAHKNKWFFDAYYWYTKNDLQLANFLDNDTQTLQQIDVNMLYNYQYSFDVMFVSSLTSWWYTQLSTSTFYMENKFYAIKSIPEKYSIHTTGFYASGFNRFTLKKDRTFFSDLTLYYMSNFIYGTQTYKNQFSLNLSFWKSLWNKRASVSIGVNDIFNTFNVPAQTKYYNQDFWFFSKPESRLFTFSFKYNFGNARLRDNNRTIQIDEGNRIK